MIHLQSVIKRKVNKNITSFPFNLPVIKELDEIKFHQPVTFLVGENGTGKSTLLEAIGTGIGSIAIGADDLIEDKTLKHARDLSKQLKFVWQRKTARGFFLRAEDFFGFAKRTSQMTQELEEMASEYEGLAKQAILKEKAELPARLT